MKDLELEFNKRFEDLKKELGFKASLKEIDEIFNVKDYILKEDYIPNNLSRSICRRISDLFVNWSNYLHNLVIPNPNYMLSITESEFFTDIEKEEFIKIMSELMEISSRNSLIGLTKDKKEEGEFIDFSVDYWNKKLNTKLKDLMLKVNKSWKEKAK